MDSRFKAGDVVQLKSGGPEMTVNKTGNAYGGTFTVWCDWFVGGKKLSEGFTPESLKLKVEGTQ